MAECADVVKAKYVVCPGWVTSKTDGDRHYISATQLMRLYNVNPQDCEVYEPQPWWPRSYYKYAEEHHRGLTRLAPRYSGDYHLPNVEER